MTKCIWHSLQKHDCFYTYQAYQNVIRLIMCEPEYHAAICKQRRIKSCRFNRLSPCGARAHYTSKLETDPAGRFRKVAHGQSHKVVDIMSAAILLI